MFRVRYFIRVLMFSLPVVGVFLLVVLGTTLVTGAMGDDSGQCLLGRVALLLGMLFVANLILLVGSLGLLSIGGSPPNGPHHGAPPQRDEPPRRSDR